MAEIFNFYVHDNRTIQFPKNNLLEPIMQEDYKVATWRFRIPKTLNGIDMSGWAWWFVYVNARGQEFSELLTLVDDIDEPDSFCTADYSIDYGISYHPGNFQFSLEAINADSGGEVLNEWHTKTYAHKVDKTLQGNQAQWAETESDIISALIIEVQNKVSQLVGGATPEPVSLIADMTDTSKVYLYVGEESGESTNYWYYYNGSAWVAGGLYASGITIDAVPIQGSNNAVRSGGVYSALANKVSKPLTSPNGTNGQLLRTLGNGQTEWADFATPTDVQVGEAVSDWLDDHPEATTTVQDRSLTLDKFVLGANGYVTPEQYGAEGDGVTDDTSAIQSAINSGFPLKLENGKTYVINKVTLYHGIVIDGNGAILKRPNLKEAPYSYTDSQIKSARMMVFSGENTNDKTTIIKNLNFDGNAWAMWEVSDGYKYESAQFILCSGTEAHPNRIIFENCTFIDNFSSAVSCTSYVYATFHNCISTHCFKGIVTFVGQGSKLDMVNIKCFNPTYDFHTINIEINGDDIQNLAQSNVNLTNVYIEKHIKLGGMSGKGVINATNLICRNMEGFDIISRGNTNIVNSLFEMTSSVGHYYLVISNVDMVENINFVNTRFRGIGEAYPRLSFRNSGYTLPSGNIAFDNCTFEHMETALRVHASNQYSSKYGVIFDSCMFRDITTTLIQGETSAWYVAYVNFIKCTIDVNESCQILNTTYGNKSAIFTFDNNRFLSDCAGIRMYGLDADQTLIFKGDLWEHGLAVSYYRSGVAYPKVFGQRYRMVENVPTEKGFNDHDIAIVTSESNAKYIYTNNAWTAMA